MKLIIGSYAEADSLELHDFDCETGSTTLLYRLPVANASFATLSDAGVLYAVTETGPDTATVSAFRLNESGFEFINRMPVHGNSPCHIAVTPTRDYVVTANYGDGSISVLPILETGALGPMCQQIRFEGHGPVEKRQACSHPHFIHFSADGTFMFVNDLGTDRIHKLHFTGKNDAPLRALPEEDIALKPGTGPRHIVYDAGGAHAYLLNEISDEVLTLTVAGSTLVPQEYTPIPDGGGHGAGDIHITADGGRLYASLRLKNDGISLFEIDSASGALRYRSHTPTGGHPRTITVTPDGRWLLAACRDADAVEIYETDADGTPEYRSMIPLRRAALVRIIG